MKRVAILLCAFFSIDIFASQQTFSTWTDDSTATGWSVPDAATAHSVFQSLDADSKKLLRDYFAERRQIRPNRRILAVKTLKICTARKRKHFFIRTSSEHYSPLSGPHTFSYWIIDDRKNILHHGGADRVDVIDTEKPFAAIDESNCTAKACYKTRYEFSAKHYRPRACLMLDLDGRIQGDCKTD